MTSSNKIILIYLYLNIMLGPIVARIGGKRKLKNIIINSFPKDYEKMIYVEPFVGGGSIFFHKNSSIKEIINDKDKDLITLFKGFKKYKGDKISAKINGSYNKDKFELIKNSDAKTPYDKFIKKLILNKVSFFGNNRNYNPSRNSVSTKYKNDYNERLKDVSILNKDYKDIIKKYDSPNTFFYLDPPYDNSTSKHYLHNKFDMNELFNLLKDIKGKFLLSFNESKQVEDLFKDFTIRHVKTKYTDPKLGNQTREKDELLISNYV